MRILICDRKFRVIQSELGSNQGEERSAVEIAEAFRAEVFLRLKVADFPGMVAAVVRGVEESNGLNTGYTSPAVGPKLFFADAVRGDNPDPGDHNPLLVHPPPTVRVELSVRFESMAQGGLLDGRDKLGK